MLTETTNAPQLIESQQRLFAAAMDYRPCPLEEIISPAWGDDHRDGWMLYVPPEIADEWSSLPVEAKIVCYRLAASLMAANEPLYDDFF